jgi:protein SCO1
MKKNTLIIYGFLLLIIVIAIVIGYHIIKPIPKLPVYRPYDLNPKLVDDSLLFKRGVHRISDFEFTNQYNEKVSNSDFDNSIYVADFFFVTCPTICPIMTKNLSKVNTYFKDEPLFKILSHTVMPEIDSVPLLFDYAQKHDATKGKWHFVTGDKKDIYKMARTSYFAVVTEGDGESHDFIHTENFILIDSKKRIRGFYDGTEKTEIDRLIKEVELLLIEEKKKK